MDSEHSSVISSSSVSPLERENASIHTGDFSSENSSNSGGEKWSTGFNIQTDIKTKHHTIILSVFIFYKNIKICKISKIIIFFKWIIQYPVTQQKIAPRCFSAIKIKHVRGRISTRKVYMSLQHTWGSSFCLVYFSQLVWVEERFLSRTWSSS